MAVCFTYLALFLLGGNPSVWCLFGFTCNWDEAHPGWTFAAKAAASGLLILLSVFRENGIVKSFREQDEYKRTGWRRMVLVEGLDDLAGYRFGVANFEAASEEQKSELLNHFKVGSRLFPASRDQRPPKLDERETRERDTAERWTLKCLATMLGYMTVHFVNQAVHGHSSISSNDVASILFQFCVWAYTLPMARVLWIEPDPRESAGELELVDEAQA